MAELTIVTLQGNCNLRAVICVVAIVCDEVEEIVLVIELYVSREIFRSKARTGKWDCGNRTELCEEKKNA